MDGLTAGADNRTFLVIGMNLLFHGIPPVLCFCLAYTLKKLLARKRKQLFAQAAALIRADNLRSLTFRKLCAHLLLIHTV